QIAALRAHRDPPLPLPPPARTPTGALSPPHRSARENRHTRAPPPTGHQASRRTRSRLPPRARPQLIQAPRRGPPGSHALRPDRVLPVVRRADLAYDRHVERRAERARNLGRDRHASTRHREDNRPLGAEMLEQEGETAASIPAIAKAPRGGRECQRRIVESG